MADMNDPARKLIKLGYKESKLMRQLMRVQAERCKLMTGCLPDMGLEPDVMARASEPKRR